MQAKIRGFAVNLFGTAETDVRSGHVAACVPLAVVLRLANAVASLRTWPGICDAVLVLCLLLVVVGTTAT